MFMGVAQILLDNLDLSHIVIGWYKLFGTSSLVAVPPGGGKPEVAAARQQHDAATAHARRAPSAHALRVLTGQIGGVRTKLLLVVIQTDCLVLPQPVQLRPVHIFCKRGQHTRASR